MRGLVVAGLLFAVPASAQDFRAAFAPASGPPPSVAAAQPELAAAMERQSRVRLEAAMSAAALDAIAREPWRAQAVLEAARAAAPEAYPAVASAVAAAFPALSAAPPSVAQAAAGRPAPYAAAERYAPPPDPSAARILAELLSAIAADPTQLEAALQRAVASAPGHREFLLREAALAFPGFAPRIGLAPSTPVRPPSGSPPRAPSEAAAPAARTRRPAPTEAISDPIEGVNRGLLAFNDVVDQAVLRPIAWTYNKVTPDPVILALRRFFANLRSPVQFASDVLQFEFADAATTLGRFGVNSTIGLLGFLEVAEPLGLLPHYADFGQTLHALGVGPGPYVMLPLLGPSTLRDGAGRVVDVLLDPLTWVLSPGQSLAVTGTQAVVRREELLKPIDELRASSVDWYAALRSTYYQRRAVELGKVAGSPPFAAGAAATDELFDRLEAEGELEGAAEE